MKITCSQNALLNGVNIVSKAVPSKTTMAILECILIDASKGEIKLTANDMEMGIETVIPDGTIEQPGIIALDAKLFSDLIRNLPKSDVTIETNETFQTVIRCENAEYKIVGKSGEDFSYIPVIPRNQPLIISQFTLREIVRQTSFSISDNDTNKMMTGILVEINGNHLKMVALDGHRISIRVIELKDSYENRKVIVPGKTLNEISKIINGSIEDMMEIYITENHIIFEFENTTMVSRLIDGEYFRYEQMMKSDYETRVRVNKRELMDSIARATLLVKEGDKKPIIMNIEDQNMELTSNSFIGSMKEDRTVEKEGKDIMIGFNPKFFMDALRVVDDEEVNLYMLNPKAPCFIKNEQETYIYIILPVNFSSVK